MVGERYLPGDFVKYNSNNGYVNLQAADSEFAQAFSHFTFEASEGKQMVLDVQGVYMASAHQVRPHMILTDPQVVLQDRSYGPGDLGEKGMRAFFKSHRCGSTCQKLRLDPCAFRKLRCGRQATEAHAPGEVAHIELQEVVRPSATKSPQSEDRSACPVPASGPETGPLTKMMAGLGAFECMPDYYMLLHRLMQPNLHPTHLQNDAAEQVQPGPAQSEPETRVASRSQTFPQKTEQPVEEAELEEGAGVDSIDSNKSIAGFQVPNINRQELKMKSVVFGPGGKKLSLFCADHADVVAAIESELRIPQDEQHLQKEASSEVGVNFYRVHRKMDVRSLRFSQSCISSTFDDGRPISDWCTT